ncbi:MAG TPA: hypothetical protein VHO70_03555 [Chitinispirillaceae bacterium]|nr:hypothetical protein [Chitinispirillaceae bacterium]
MFRYFVCMLFLLVTVPAGASFSITDTPEGWASQSGGTTGGGAGGTIITVSTMSQLQTEAKSSGKKILIVPKGTYTGRLVVSSDKTIVGKEPGVLIQGSVIVSGASNVILRNFAVKGDRCNSYDECKGGYDAMAIEKSAHHVWLDHLDISDGQDGNCDVTKAADFVTITWCKFWYSYMKEHRFSNLISSDDNVAEDKGKLNITYAYCWWADKVDQRQPRGRSGKVHVINNLYTSAEASYACGPGVDIQMLIENNVFKNGGSAIEIFDGTPKPAFKSVGNTGTAKNINLNQGTVFTPPYTLSLKMNANEVESKVKPSAGNTLTLTTTGGHHMVMKNSTSARPFVTAAKGGWILYNPSNMAISFSVMALDGKMVYPVTRLDACKSYRITQSGMPMLVHFNDARIGPDLYIPHVN